MQVEISPKKQSRKLLEFSNQTSSFSYLFTLSRPDFINPYHKCPAKTQGGVLAQADWQPGSLARTSLRTRVHVHITTQERVRAHICAHNVLVHTRTRISKGARHSACFHIICGEKIVQSTRLQGQSETSTSTKASTFTFSSPAPPCSCLM